MNHKNVYDKIINKAKKSNRFKSKLIYYENHHIIPKSCEGNDSPNNLVLLTAKEHYAAHHLLCYIYPENNKLKFAFWAMNNQLKGDVKRDYKVSSRTYEYSKKMFAIANSKLHSGKKISDKHIAIARKRMLSDSNPMKGKKGKDNPLYKRKRSKETLAKISASKRKNPEKHPSFKGYCVTPKGKFSLNVDAAKAHGVSVDIIKHRCKANLRTVNKISINRYSDLDITMLGKTYKELGFYFISRSEIMLPSSS